ncbi:MAG: YhgE/Pip domain-containing protein [Tumebacillaceae bacterium]
MNTFWIFRTELRRLFRSRIGRAALIVGLIIPLLYSSLYLYAFWDPYKQMDQFPVALVNEDQGGVRNGQPVQYGQEIADKLVKDHEFNFVPLGNEEAKAGLEKGQYYLMVTIPSNFTADALSVEGDHPHRAQVQFRANEGANYIASTISSRLETGMREKLGNQFSEEYLKGIFNVIGDAGNGLTRAADGANKIATGAGDLASGARDAADGAKKLADGAAKAANGSTQLAAKSRQLSDGIITANNGAQDVASGATRLKQGAINASAGSDKLANGLIQSTNGVRTVRDQLSASVGGTDKLATGLDTMQSALGGLGANGQPKAPTTQDPRQMAALDMLGLLAQKYGFATDALYQGALQKISGVSNGLVDATNQVQGSKAGLARAVGGLDQIATAQDEMVNGAKTIAAGNKQLAAGLTSLSDGATKLGDGTKQLATGSVQLANGAQQVADGNRQLATGTHDLADGTTKLRDGSKDLASGSRTLADELTKATSESTVKNPDEKAAVMADPIATVSEPLHPVASYGMGFASYFIPLSLWVGALVLYFILSMTEYRWIIAPVPSVAIVLGKFFTLALVGVGQAVISSIVLTQVLGLQVLHMWEFYVFNILIAWTSIAIIGLLIARLGSGPGRFISILLLILQLTSSAGTFPIELVPTFFRTIHPFLPMSYGIEALRSIIATGDQAVVWRDMGIIAGILVGVLLIQIVTTRRTLKVRDLHEKDVLAG